jgi:hypothetical protein
MTRPFAIALAFIVLFALTSARAADVHVADHNAFTEIALTSGKAYADPFNEVELDVVFTTPSGKELRIPAYWAGGGKWCARYASAEVGDHKFTTICSDITNASLHGQKGRVSVKAYTGDNPLLKHGPIRVAADKRHFEHADGTPFFWLGDTWWMGLCNRLTFDDFKTLAGDRKAKGFNVVQIVAGLYPDMFPFDPRGANEAGYPWENDYARINPAYFDAADKRIEHLVEQGISPCIVGAWGYFMPWMGVKKMEQHWRYLIARYGAMPVTWCAAGEANLNWYLAKPFPIDDRKQVTDWTEVMRYIRATDGFHHPLTIHPTGIGRLSARHATDDVALLDFDMLQTPHGERAAVEPTVATVRQSYADQPIMPVIDGEASYERLMDSIGTEWTRMMLWLCMTNGAAGHTYGANGIWQVNRKGQPHGPSPHHPAGSVGYGKIPWDEAMNLPGSTQVALGKKLFERFAWQKFAPHPEWAAYEPEPGADAPPSWKSWIWFEEGSTIDAPIARRRFRKTFDVSDAKIASAVIHLGVDNHCVAYVNGQKVAEQTGWAPPRRIDIAPLLKPGKNVLAIETENVASANVTKNPAGLVCAGDVRYADGTSTSLATDDSWKASDALGDGAWTAVGFSDERWPAAKVAAKYGEGPWGTFGQQQGGAIPPYATGIAGEVRIIYVAQPRPVRVSSLDAGGAWKAEIFNPVTGETKAVESFTVEKDGSARVAAPGFAGDWVLVVQRVN